MKAPQWLRVCSLGFLEAGDDVVNRGIENFYFTAEVEAKNAGVLQEPVLSFLGADSSG
jgi:hypothetical protein